MARFKSGDKPMLKWSNGFQRRYYIVSIEKHGYVFSFDNDRGHKWIKSFQTISKAADMAILAATEG